MSDPSSYIEQEERQGALFCDADILAAVEHEESQGRYTSDRLATQRPQVYRLVVRLLSEGMPLRQITRTTGCHHYTIQQVAAREPRAIEAQKEQLGQLGRYGARLCAERLVELVEESAAKDLTVKDLAIAHGILVERSELLLGGATARVEHADAERIEDLRQVFDALPAGEPVEPVAAGESDGQRGAGEEQAGPGKPAEAGEAAPGTPAEAGEAGKPDDRSGVDRSEDQQRSGEEAGRSG